ncbi:MAG: thiol:disulfide interchange protein DsbG [Gammaproteobacteria bacterium]|nr:thiol:disulfide interchange protein DsbG [Gammaproteobacteria bacterium]MBU1443548.1 thiol:disulfide interchange protein DsbG [Gammaproteobacteria bacterium]MBU2287849.1 thiol:disulfide interchange protein DsbG [Gammaproteobacteria bacterium]
MAVQSAGWAQAKPDTLRALESRGITVVGTFPAAGGLTAWAAFKGQTPLALYATPDGKHVVAGTMLDARGDEVNQAALEQAVAKPMTQGAWSQVERSTWIADGSDKAAKVVYVLTDPNCPYCNKLWSDARPWVDSGKVQLRHIIVGILTPTSAGKAAALLADRNPAAALDAHERKNVAANAKALSSGRPRPLADDGLKPLASIPPAIEAKLNANEKLMASLRLQATPALIWRDAKGMMQTRTGAPDGALPDIFGPL